MARAPMLSDSSGELSVPPEALEFSAVYDLHVDFVWRSLRALGVPERHVDDAVQEAFLVVHRRLAEFEGRSSLRSWLFAIARRVALRARRTAKRDARSEELQDFQHESPAPGPFEMARQEQATRMLLQLLSQLDDDKRAVFVLIELEQMNVPEAAAALGWNVNTTYSRLRLAREKFKRAARRLQETTEVTYE